MLKKIVIIVLVFGFISCEKEPSDSYKISATTDSFISGSMARIFRVDNRKKNVLDSAIIDNGAFVFEGSVTYPDKFYLTIENVFGALPLIVANETFEIEITTDSIEGSKIKGSKENKMVKTYLGDLKYLQDAYNELSDEYKAFKQKADEDGMKAIRISFDSLVLEAVKFDVKFIEDNPNTTLSALTLERITMAKQIPDEEVKTLYNNLSKNMQETRAAKYALEFINEQNNKQKTE